jgi:hypothetical protein
VTLGALSLLVGALASFRLFWVRELKISFCQTPQIRVLWNARMKTATIAIAWRRVMTSRNSSKRGFHSWWFYDAGRLSHGLARPWASAAATLAGTTLARAALLP